LGILHDHSGQLVPPSPGHRIVYGRVRQFSLGLFSFAHLNIFQYNTAEGLPNGWRPPACGRFLINMCARYFSTSLVYSAL
jgi:hypothetical protein